MGNDLLITRGNPCSNEAAGGNDFMSEVSHGCLPGQTYEMNLEIGLTSWLELISPWNVTITFPSPSCPAAGGHPGST